MQRLSNHDAYICHVGLEQYSLFVFNLFRTPKTIRLDDRGD